MHPFTPDLTRLEIHHKTQSESFIALVWDPSACSPGIHDATAIRIDRSLFKCLRYCLTSLFTLLLRLWRQKETDKNGELPLRCPCQTGRRKRVRKQESKGTKEGHRGTREGFLAANGLGGEGGVPLVKTCLLTEAFV